MGLCPCLLWTVALGLTRSQPPARDLVHRRGMTPPSPPGMRGKSVTKAPEGR